MGQWNGLEKFIPWDWLRNLYRSFRRNDFSKPRKEGTYLRVKREDASLRDVKIALGWVSYAPNWEWSYDEGADLNLAQIVYESTSHRFNGEPVVWWQTHVRGYTATDDSYTDYKAHWEPAPLPNDAAHIEGVGFSRKQGMDNLRGTFEHHKIPFEEVEWKRNNG